MKENVELKQRRRLLKSCMAVGALPFLQPLAAGAAAPWPDKALRMVVAFPAGGPTDVTSRLVGRRLADQLGQPLIIDNKVGASGSIGTVALIKSPADGYTVSMFGMPSLIAPIVYRSNQYDVRKDFTCVATVYDLPLVIVVNPSVMPGVNTLADLVGAAKKKPINYSSPGVGSIAHLAMEQLMGLAGFSMQHVGYKGSAPAITDLLGGQISVMFVDLIAAMPYLQSGRLKAVALGAPNARRFLPDVAPIAEQGFADYSVSSWSGLIVPNGTSTEVVQRLDRELRLILNENSTQESLAKMGALSAYQPPEVMKRRLASEYERWSQVAREKNISL